MVESDSNQVATQSEDTTANADMIPLRLSVRNFLCYRGDVPPLDLRGVHVACLCGDNGHGKSALLDAITWCLWGQARTGSRNHDALITHGEAECRVELDFEARGQVYRAMRRRRRAGRGQTQVDLFVLDDAENPSPLTSNTLGETNARIRQIVGMGYDTFVNSAFLVQGRSDEFMRKTPADRKDTLSAILGLNLYDALQAAARDLRDGHRSDLAHHTDALQRHREVLDSTPDPSDDLEHMSESVATLSYALAAQAAEAERLRAEVARLLDQRAALDGTAQQVETLQSHIAQADSDAAAAEARIHGTRFLAAQSKEIADGVGHLNQARDRLQELETRRAANDRLVSGLAELQRTVDQTEARLRASAEELSRRIAEELEPLAGHSGPIIEQLLAMDQIDAAINEEQASIVAQVASVTELRRELASNEAETNQCVEEGKTFRARLEDMQAADAVCPLCGTPLSEDACENIVGYYESELNRRLLTHRELTTVRAEMTERLVALNADTEGSQRSLAGRQRRVQQDRAKLDEDLRRSERAAREIAELLPRLDAQKQALCSGDFARDDRREIAGLQQRVSMLDYDESARRHALELTQSLQQWELRQVQLQSALASLEADEANLRGIQTQAARWRDELAAAQERMAGGQAAVAGLPAVQQQEAAAEQSVNQLRIEIEQVSQRQAVLLATAESRRQHQAEVDRLSALRIQAQGEFDVYAELFAAFGRGGVPTMLIDAAVPRIEAEANVLLGRMTDGRMSVKLETQRANQAGGITETLDILVSDELGTRGYEVFSGGEAFRINLSLRIALSKLLSQRMGVPLPTLFIDEGFGTQDAAGRERIIDTITSIQDQFEKIIVITHLEDLKNLFDVHIQVEKLPAGSRFELVAN